MRSTWAAPLHPSPQGRSTQQSETAGEGRSDFIGAEYPSPGALRAADLSPPGEVKRGTIFTSPHKGATAGGTAAPYFLPDLPALSSPSSASTGSGL